MALCKNCNREVSEADVFCPFCGTNQKQSDEETSADSSSLSEFADEHRAPDLAEIEARNPARAIAVEQADVPRVEISVGKNERADGGEMQSESALMSYGETEVKEGSAVEELNREVFNAHEQNSEANNREEVKQIPYIAPAVESEVDAKENSDDAGNENNSLDFGNKPYAATEKPIEKPATELEKPENQSTKSVFDSVRIMQTPISKPRNYADEQPAASDSSGAASKQARDSDKVKGTLTTPNIGGGDTDGKKSSKLKPLDEGTVLNNRYEIIRKIGGGGMGAVYLASDKNLGGVLRAVKEMVQSYIEGEQHEKAVADFKRESMLLTSLEHNSIPTIYDYFFDEQEARFYLVMKYISGGDLSARLRATVEGRLDEKTVTEWAIQIADVLDYLHNRQPPIVYRDLKPANIMVDANSGRAMLIDFGIARWVNKEEKGVTAVGTMGYAPPELFSGNVEPRSDIYSLGSTLFHLLTGADPQNNPLLIFDFQKNPRPRQINPQLSDQMEKILMRAVEYSADKRFASAAEMRAALNAHLENLKTNKVTHGVREVPEAIGLAEQTVFCGFCGQKITATDMFCAFCGSKQPLAREGINSAAYSSKNITAQILIVGTN